MRGWPEREWLELLADLMATPLTELPVEPLARQLNRTFDAVACAFCAPRADGSFEAGSSSRPERVDALEVEVVEWITSGAGALSIERVHPMVRPHPILRFYLETGRVGVIRFSGAEVAGPMGVVASWSCPHQLAVPLASHGYRAFVLGRDAEFAEREVDLLERIRRLIVGLDQLVRTFAGGRVQCAAGTSNARITSRELAVLEELARGVTATAISRRLGISERTVHKHLEHIYDKLEVTNRLSAVLRARDAGLIAAR
jgi:DNA-binding CsgD family transcriptional regulator